MPLLMRKSVDINTLTRTCVSVSRLALSNAKDNCADADPTKPARPNKIQS
jgi:hypothetical protein